MAPAPFSVILIDDEPGARGVIKGFISQFFPQIVIKGEAGGVSEGVSLLLETRPDLVFLDIEMEDGTGFDLLDRLPEIQCQIIFITAHDDLAIKAFRYHALDYLLKPVDPDDFREAVQRAMQHGQTDVMRRQVQLLLETHRDKTFDRITLNTSTGHVFTQTHDIIRIETYGNYSFVFLTGGERLLVSRNLKEFEEMLPEPDFFRIHQSHIVNTRFVKKVIKEDGDQVVMTDGMKIPVSRRRKEEFLNVVLNKGK